MNSRSILILAMTLAVTLSACGGGGPRRGPPPEVINRILTGAPGEAQPSTIVATEVAYARDAQEQGHVAAAGQYAASAALFHGRNGPAVFPDVAGALEDGHRTREWSPRTVVMSCDGALALTQGRFRDSDGFVGNYVTAWVRQPDNSYKWSYDVAGRDDPQPPPRREFDDGDIVVTAIDAVTGLVATCPPRGQTVPPPPALSLGEDIPGDAQLSGDGTLRWRWEHRGDGTKFVAAEYFYEGAWITAIEENLASPPEE